MKILGRRKAGGRPKGSVKLDTDIIDVLQQSLRNGWTIKGACRSAGVSYSSFRRWRILGKEKRQGIYRAFHRAINPIFEEKDARWREYCRQVIEKELARIEKRNQQILAYNQRILAYRRRRSF